MSGVAGDSYGVPYFAQWVSADWVRPIVEDGADPCDDPGWEDAGFDTPDDYRFWARRICGLACLESILTHWALPVPSRAELVRAALKWGAFVQVAPDRVEGLIYAPFAEWVAAEFGLHVEVHPDLPIEELAALLERKPFVIASVSTEIRYPDRPNVRRGGHLVLVHRQTSDGLVLHNPSGVPPYQANAVVPVDTFERFYAGRAMSISKRQGSGAWCA